MFRRFRFFAVLGTAAVLVAACGEAPEADRGVELVEGQRSEPGFAEASLTIEAPEPGAVLEDSVLRARLSLTGFELGAPTPGREERGLALSENGQHVHFIVDNRPYRALYDLSEPVEVSDLEPGVHLLRAFASRQWHESVKSPDAFAMTWFVVGEEEADRAEGAADRAPVEPGSPVLTYSRPKGSYEGTGADSVMVDFYLRNVQLGPGGEGYRVRLTVDDSLNWELTRWAPHYLLGLDDGRHAVQLELLGPDGTPVAGEHSATEREIEVSREAGDGDGEQGSGES